MIEQKTHKLKISQAEAEAKKAGAKVDSVYDPQKGEFTFKANRATGKNFRLVHNGETALAVIDGTEKTVTTTIYQIEEFDTKKKALDRIDKLGLEYENPEQIQLEEIIKENNYFNTFIDWAEERPRRRAIIIVDANQHDAATQIVKQVDIIGGDNTFSGLGLSETGKGPATHFWCNWNCSASEYDFFGKQNMLWWRVYDGQEIEKDFEKVDDFLASIDLKRIIEIKKGLLSKIWGFLNKDIF